MIDRSDSYLMIKRGLYWRPNACGYTGVKDQAGRYTLDEVAVRVPKGETVSESGVSFIHEDDAPDYAPSCCEGIKMRHLLTRTFKGFQHQVSAWILQCFPQRIAGTRGERTFRFLEEALELCQALDLSKDDAMRVVEYVYGRPAGEPSQEVGGTMITLAALCWNDDIDLQDAAFTELARISQPEIMEKIRAKQDAKAAVGMGMAT